MIFKACCAIARSVCKGSFGPLVEGGKAVADFY